MKKNISRKPAKNPEDLYFNSLTLGLMKALKRIPRIENVTCTKNESCTVNQVKEWEELHSIYLPEDIKKFYLSMDGFKIVWSFEYEVDDIRRCGYIHIPHLNEIVYLRQQIPQSSIENEMNSSASRPKDINDNELPIISASSKIFEINDIIGLAKVCLVYESDDSSPKICLLELKSFEWVFLANDFTAYLRMAIAHLGLPFWQLCFSNIKLPPWAEQLFRLIAPHLLDNNEPRLNRSLQVVDEHPYNKINPRVFRSRSKSSKDNRPAKN